MRKIIVSNMVTIDGYFEGTNKDLSWPKMSDEFFAYARKIFDTVDTMLFGRLTYELMLAYWPNSKDDDPVITDKMNSLPKIVFSNTLSKVEWGKWNNATLMKGNIIEQVTKLKQGPGKDMVILGSGSLVTQLAQSGLIDEYRIIVSPIILGEGSSMFKGVGHKINLTLLKTETFASGVVVLFYKPA